ncbi:hypothetical protein [Candidatus Finniella inopinata]|uniref:Uncharacterized protein n=1 Tax=Candidatus Finniella inopinata TaxID=1696036 RepID=A0A4Q7DG69_9PROT|nr:hypothetical protein [Candidatus Finniella inopinata]RZI45841.1 hypothetical protein EQU50_05245 [Candidatus Finniella inopinata]
MYKISVFFIILTMGLILKKVDATVQSAQVASQQTAAPVVVGSGVEEPEQKSSHPRKRKKHQLTHEEFKKHVEDKFKALEEVKTKIMPLRDKVEESEKSWFDLSVKCASNWIEALKGYQSLDTNIYRSDRLAHKELKAAEKLTKLKPSHHQAKSVYPEKDIQKLEERFNEIKGHADKLTGDNLMAFNAMINCAKAYIDALDAAKGQTVSVRRLLSQAMNYVNTAETFAHYRIHTNVAK